MGVEDFVVEGWPYRAVVRWWCSAVVLLLALAAQGVETFRIPFVNPSVVAPRRGAASMEPEYVDVTLKGTFYAPFELHEAGPHTVWIEYSTPTNGRANAAVSIISAATGETVHWERYDFEHCLPRERPYMPRAFSRKQGVFLHGFDMDFETPGKYIVNIYAADGCLGRANVETRGVWITSDPALSRARNRNVWPGGMARRLAPTNAPAAPPAPPPGFVPARDYPFDTSLNTSIVDKNRRFAAFLHQNGMVFNGVCDAELVNLGFVGFARGHGHGLVAGAGVRASGKTYDEAYSNNVRRVQAVLSDPVANSEVVQWDISWEGAASFNWGRTNVFDRYRGWLRKKYGSIGALNRAWRSSYADFQSVTPPANRGEVLGPTAIADPKARGVAKANFIDYREHCAEVHANEMKARAAAARDADPERRRITAAFSNLDLNAVTFSGWRASDFDVIIDRLAEAGATHFGYDAYAADDFIGMEIDEFSAFGDERLTINCSETSTHTPDPTLAVRSFWTGVGKGVGMWAMFQHQEGGWNIEFPKFGNTDPATQTPRPKLAAISDAVRAVHQIEDIYVDSRKEWPGKPVAIYYSRTCNALQERGYGSIFDSSPDSVFRVYELLRASGAPVTFVSDRQILRRDSRLSKISALVLVDAQYMPQAVVDKVSAWVRSGGHVLADAQVGIFDEHGYPCERILPLFGITPGGGRFTRPDPDKLHLTDFTFESAASQSHPVARAIGPAKGSGFGVQKVSAAKDCAAIMENVEGGPGFVIRTVGKGSAAYFAGYLGSFFGGAPSQYEWRDGHADRTPYRLAKAWLDYAGVVPVETNSYDGYVADKLRFETPLVDGRGNAILNVENYSFLDTPHGRVVWNMPAGARRPATVLMLKHGTRRLERLAFEWDDASRTLSADLPPFGPYAAVLSLADAPSPLVSLEVEAPTVAPQEGNSLPVIRPGEELVVRAHVVNASASKLGRGKVTLRLPHGWFHDRGTADVPSLRPGETSKEVTFRVRPPDWCAMENLRPVNVIYEAKGGARSMPTVQMVWWRKPPEGSGKAGGRP